MKKIFLVATVLLSALLVSCTKTDIPKNLIGGKWYLTDCVFFKDSKIVLSVSYQDYDVIPEMLEFLDDSHVIVDGYGYAKYSIEDGWYVGPTSYNNWAYIVSVTHKEMIWSDGDHNSNDNSKIHLVYILADGTVCDEDEIDYYGREDQIVKKVEYTSNGLRWKRL